MAQVKTGAVPRAKRSPGHDGAANLEYYKERAMFLGPSPVSERTNWIYRVGKSCSGILQNWRLRAVLWFNFVFAPLCLAFYLFETRTAGLITYLLAQLESLKTLFEDRTGISALTSFFFVFLDRRLIYSTIALLIWKVSYRTCLYLLAPLPEIVAHKNDLSYLARIGCIVPCHKSAQEVTQTVNSLLKYLKPEHIMVVDNGNSIEPMDNTREIIAAIDPKINYVWVPIGMKTNALWKGLSLLPPEVEYVLHVDDDTFLSDDFVFDERVWDDPQTIGLSFGIQMVKKSQVGRLVDYEFKIRSLDRYFMSRYSTVWFCYGIVGLWRRAELTDIFRCHPFLPFGEDGWIGITNLTFNGQIRQELRCNVFTFAPSAIFPGGYDERAQGYGASNVWKQRAERWYVNQPRRFFIRLYLLLFYRSTTWVGSFLWKLTSFSHLVRIVGVVLLPPLLLSRLYTKEIAPWHVLYVCIVYCFSNWMTGMFTNSILWRRRPDYQSDSMTIVVLPLYTLSLLIMEVFGHWRSLLYYIPFVPPRFGMYTEEGCMTADLLHEFHGIEVEDGALQKTKDGTFDVDEEQQEQPSERSPLWPTTR